MCVIKAVRWALLIMPVIIPFYQQNGLSMTEILLLQSIFAIAIVVLEIPTGYIADVIGRRLSIVIGCILGFLGYVTYSLSYDFFGFLVGELLIGFGSSFMSGADSALLYDSLSQLRKEKDYKKVEGKYQAMGNFSEGIAGVAGGFLALISLRTPLYIQTILLFSSILIAISLVEPKRHKFHASEIGWKGLMSIVKYALHGERRLKWLILYSAVISTATLMMVWLAQPYFLLVSLPLFFFGIIWAALNFSVGFFSIYAHKVESVLGKKDSLTSLVILSALGFALLGIFKATWAIAFILILYFVRAINGPITKHYVNELASPDKRATILSIQAMSFRLFFAIAGPLAGWVTDVYSLQTAFLASSATVLLLGFVCIWKLRKYNSL